MYSSIALPPRTTGRHAKRRRAEEDAGARAAGASETSAGGSATSSSAFSPRYSASEPCYEYLDHTADVQIHSWGDTLEDAFAQNALGMFGYMTEAHTVDVDASLAPEGRVIEARGHDLVSLLYGFLDAALFVFSSGDSFLIKDMHIEALVTPGGEKDVGGGSAGAAADGVGAAAAAAEGGSSGAAAEADAAAVTPSAASVAAAPVPTPADTYYIRARCWGEVWDTAKHPQGTEIKAITYSNMQVWRKGLAAPFSANEVVADSAAAASAASPPAHDAAAAAAAPASTTPSAAHALGGAASSRAAGSAPQAKAGGGAGAAVDADPSVTRKGVFDVFVIVDI